VRSSSSKYTNSVFFARTLQGELTALPDPLAGFQGAASQMGRERRGGKERKEMGGRRRGAFPPILFFTV